MPELCDLQIHVNGQQTFFVNEEIISKFSGKLRKIIKQEKRRTQIRNSGINVDDFPGGPDGFELVSRFCYNNGAITITVSNVPLLHCCAVFLGMTKSKKVSTCNLLQQTETFLEGMFYWSWNDLLSCLKSCEPFFSYADSSGLVQKLMSSLLSKIAQNSDINFSASSSYSSSSPDTAASGRFKPCSSNSIKAWWLDDLTILPPKIMEKFVKTLGAYGSDNNSSLALTKFLLHYLKSKGSANSKSDYGGLADTAVHGVISVGKSSFSCRGLLSVMRVVTGFGLSRDCRAGLERLIGGMLDEATLDDLLVSGHNHNHVGVVYDVNLVLRLVRLFVHRDDRVPVQKMKKVGRLIDKYLGEIAPDHNLKISKFLRVAECLPDFARDCFDGVYRATDIYLQSHPGLSLEERSRLCRCLRYEKLSLEACKDLAKNPRIPPRIAVQALVSQHPNIPTTEFDDDHHHYHQESTSNTNQMVMMYKRGVGDDDAADQSFPEEEEENEDLKLNLQRMRWRVVKLEKVCREMKGQMSRMILVKSKVIHAPPPLNRALPRLC